MFPKTEYIATLTLAQHAHNAPTTVRRARMCSAWNKNTVTLHTSASGGSKVLVHHTRRLIQARGKGILRLGQKVAVHTVKKSAQLWALNIEGPIYSSMCYNSGCVVYRREIALEGNVTWIYLATCSHALESASTAVGLPWIVAKYAKVGCIGATRTTRLHRVHEAGHTTCCTQFK